MRMLTIHGLSDKDGLPVSIPSYGFTINGIPQNLIKISDIKKVFNLSSVSDHKIVGIAGYHNVHTFKPAEFDGYGKPCRFITLQSLFKILVFYSASNNNNPVISDYVDFVFNNLNGGFAKEDEENV